MITLTRLALAAVLSGAVALPAFAEDAHGAPAGKPPVTRVAAGPDVTRPDVTKPAPGKPAPGTPGLGKPAEKPAVMTGNGGSHAPVTQAPPPAADAGAPKPN